MLAAVLTRSADKVYKLVKHLKGGGSIYMEGGYNCNSKRIYFLGKCDKNELALSPGIAGECH